MAAGCSFVIWASSVIFLSEQTTRGTSESDDLLVTTVSNMSNIQLSPRGSQSCQSMPAPHRSQPLGVWECGGQHTGTRRPPASSLTTFKTTLCLSPQFFCFFIALPTLWSSAQVLLVYYISPTQRKWTLFPSTSKDLGCTQAFRCADWKTRETMRHLVPEAYDRKSSNCPLMNFCRNTVQGFLLYNIWDLIFQLRFSMKRQFFLTFWNSCLFHFSHYISSC